MSKVVHKNHITRTWMVGTTQCTSIDTNKCPVCSLEREISEKKQIAGEKLMLDNSQPLLCNKCNKHIGYVYEYDLNGCRFYCTTCRTDVEVDERGHDIQCSSGMNGKCDCWVKG